MIGPHDNPPPPRGHDPRDGGPACPDLLDLAAYVDGRLGAAEHEAIEAHLARCRACFAAVRDARSIEAEAAGPAPLVPAHVLEAARGLVPATGTATPVVLARLGPVARWGLGVAASLAVCVVGYRAGLRAAPVEATDPDRILAEASFGALDLETEVFENDELAMMSLLLSGEVSG